MLLLLLLACAPEDPSRRGEDKLYDMIEGYPDWGAPAAYAQRLPGHDENGGWVEMFWNEVALDAIAQGATQLPQGSAIVKDSYTDETSDTLRGSTVMVRIEQDWAYARLTPEGELAVIGRRELSCLGCHARAPDERFTAE